MSSLEGFVLTGDAIEAAEGMLSLADLGNGSGIVAKESLMMRTYQTDFDNITVTARLPICFGREYGPRMEEYVMLRDPRNNEIEVRLERRKKKEYFVNGWFGLKDFYDLNLGAWADLTFENPKLLTMVVKSRFDKEIDYPDNTPPIISKLDRRVYGGGKISFYTTHTIVLTESDVSTGFLVVPWHGFCQHRLDRNATRITVVDYMGFEWKCDFRFVQRGKTLCSRIGGDWGMICKARRLKAGRSIELAVIHEKNNDVLYVKYVPRKTGDGEFPKGLDPKLCLEVDAAVFNLKDIGADIDAVRHDLYKLKTYRVEFDVQTEKTRLPPCFAKEVGVHIDGHIMLQDPNQNLIVVQVQKRNDKVYFMHGWLKLKDVYDIKLGAWVNVTYVQPNLMLMTIRERTGVEVSYPRNPYLTVPMFTDLKGETSVVHFYRIAVKILTYSDMHSGYLMLPYYGFCEKALPKTAIIITLVDYLGIAWKCDLSFVLAGDMVYCRLGGDWSLICEAWNLQIGYALKIAAEEEKDSTILAFRHVPLQCTHRAFVKPTNVVNGKYTYQVNHYLLRCPVKSKME